jgi:hypothetical protein
VEGCGAVLLAANADISTYNLRYRVCEMHLRAEAVLVKGKLQRFCQARRLAAHTPFAWRPKPRG